MRLCEAHICDGAGEHLPVYFLIETTLQIADSGVNVLEKAARSQGHRLRLTAFVALLASVSKSEKRAVCVLYVCVERGRTKQCCSK